MEGGEEGLGSREEGREGGLGSRMCVRVNLADTEMNKNKFFIKDILTICL